ncbi:MAG: putative transcriptional regulator [Frankiales bacterium]|nr:putative transcriptional regulator [Frankiales bacterium]
MTASSRARFAEVVRAEPVDIALAALLVGAEVEPTLDTDQCLALLDGLAERARPLDRAVAPAEVLPTVLSMFEGVDDDFDDLRASLLPEVLRRHRGLPLLLSVVWVEVATRLGLAASYGRVPGRVVVVLGELEDEHTVVDPFTGRLVTGAVEAVGPHELILRLLTNIRALTARQPRSLDAARTRLWAVELSLLVPTHPLELRRERGELMVRLGAHLEGAAELEEYAALVDDLDESTAEACRREARQARARLN